MNFSKIAKLTLIVIIVVMQVGLVVQAGNTTDTYYELDFTDFDPRITLPRPKYNTTSVYTLVYNSPVSYNVVKTFGGYSGGYIMYNCTIGSQATVRVGVQSSIRNLIVENGWSEAALSFENPNVIPRKITGVWSPDSSRTYTVVN